MPLFRRSVKAPGSDPSVEARRSAGGDRAARPASVPGSGGADEAAIRAVGRDFLDAARKNRTGVLSKAFWSDKLMDWSMKDHEFKVQLFRFVDAFPVLRHDPELVHDHLIDYLGQPGVKLPPGMDMGLSAGSMAKGMMTRTITGQIESMAQKFIAGEDAASALWGLEKLWKRGVAFSVDLLGEACVSDAEADAYRDKYLDLVKNLPERVAGWPGNDRLERDHLGAIPRVNVSVKVTSLSARLDPIDPEGAMADCMERLVPILEEAGRRGAFINFDMEQFALKDLTMSLFERCGETVDFEGGIALQAYLKSGDADARRVAEWARRTGKVVTVRLVKGAYWDYETIHAEQMGWPCPVWNTKPETDACFERMTEVLLDATPRSEGEGGVKLALGSHNARSIARGLAGLERRGLPREAIELQMLHGMADQLKAAAAEMGLRVREYVPVGEMIPGMAYLVRRLLENTSNESWLKAGFLDNADAETLLADPVELIERAKRGGDDPGRNGSANGSASGNGSAGGLVGGGPARDLCELAPERHRLSPAVEGVGDGRPFATEPLRDFADGGQRDAFERAIRAASVPEAPNTSTAADADRALGEASAAFGAWRDADPVRRARVLTRAARALRERRDEISGVVIKENGKGWVDADADVTEAIDFMEYYARHAPGLFRPERLGRYIGELNEQWHQPRGVAAVISPWNFPLAIAAGMTSAALVTGNTVVLKPAEQTPGIARVLADVLWDAIAAEFPAGGRRGESAGGAIEAKKVLHFLPGPGEEVGAALVRDPRVSLLAFTGSKAVGLDIIRAAGETREDDGQHFVKKVVCEMGGKNAIVVDVSADLDEAVLGVRRSAFGFQGQKCSACSRCVVVDPEGPEGRQTRLFVERLVESSRSLVIGSPLDGGSDVGPVIDDEAHAKITAAIERARADGLREELAMDPPADVPDDGVRPRRYVGPHIFSGVEPHHDLAVNEVFGPVLAVMHARTFGEALAIANGHRYKLTGGVYSRKPAHLERAKRDFRVGNLYLNRNITGALVGRQPFGGFGLSGVGSKAGGDEYLFQFVEPRAMSENTMRRGFAPEL